MRIISVVCVFGLVGCGGPVLQNAPRVNPGAVAGAAAAIAGAATLAAPYRKPETNKSSELRPQKAGPMVPADVLDRLDEAQRRPR